MSHRPFLNAALIATGLVLAAGCTSSNTASTTGTTAAAANDPYGSATTTTAKAAGGGSATSTPGSSVAAASGKTVAVAEVPKYGKILVGPNGHSLYFFEKDTRTTSACKGDCATVWPGLAAEGAPTAGAGVDATKLTTAAGQVPNQVVYNGHLLYEFATDEAAGDVNGASVPHWYLLSPTGEEIEAS